MTLIFESMLYAMLLYMIAFIILRWLDTDPSTEYLVKQLYSEGRLLRMPRQDYNRFSLPRQEGDRDNYFVFPNKNND